MGRHRLYGPEQSSRHQEPIPGRDPRHGLAAGAVEAEQHAPSGGREAAQPHGPRELLACKAKLSL